MPGPDDVASWMIAIALAAAGMAIEWRGANDRHGPGYDRPRLRHAGPATSGSDRRCS